MADINHQDARQGITGMGVRYVLGWGLGLVIVAFIVIYWLMY
jgi:hypothetical protein